MAEEKKDKKEKKDKEITEESLELEKQELEIIIAQNKALGEKYTAQQNQLKLLAKLKEFQDLAYQDAGKLADLEKQLSEEQDANSKKKIQAQIDELKAAEKRAEGYKKLIKELEEETKGTKKLSKAQKEAKKSFNDSFGGFATAIGLNSKMMNNFVGGITKFTKLAKKHPEQLKQAFKETFSVQKMSLAVIGQVVSASLQLAMAADKASAAFAANTGAGRIMTAQISEVGGGFRNIGLDAEKAGQAAQDLYNNFSGFMSIGKEAQKELMATVASLGRLGVDGQTASKTLTLFNKNMGMSLKQSQQLTKQLAMMGTKIGISSSQMIKGFADASKSLAVYGKDAVKVFTDLAAQAKAANVETATLMGIAEKFDTFSGAADSAGKLNAILGTQISATEMLTMKENERIETLITSMQAQGRSFKDMDRFSQKAIASAAGISDMAEAQRIFGMSVSDYRKGLQTDPKEEQFQQALKDTMDIMEKLKKIGQQFAVSLAPVLDGVAKFFQWILDINNKLGGYLIPTIASIAAGLIIVPKIIGLIMPLLSLLGVAMPTAGAGLGAFAGALAAAAPAFLQGSVGLLAVGAALGLMALGILGMSKAFGGSMDVGSILGFFIGLSGGLIALAGAFSILGLMAINPFMWAGMGVAAGGILAIGAALALVDVEKVNGLVKILDVLTGDKKVTFDVNIISNLTEFTDGLFEKSATLKPVLGDLALITTGKTTQSIIGSTVSNMFNTFNSKIDNIFKPNITVKIGEKELRGIIDEQVAKTASDTNQ